MLEAWASQKSFQRKDGDTDGDGRDFRGQDRKNDTHASTTMLSTHWRCGPQRHRTVGADKAYDTADFVDQVREIEITPHVAQNETRCGGSAIDARTTRHAGYAMS